MQTTLEPIVALERPQATLSNCDIIAEHISKETATGKTDFRPRLKKSNHAVLCERWVPHQVSALTYFALHTV